MGDRHIRDFIEREAAAAGVKPHALQKWRTRGIPHKFRLLLLRRAAMMGVPLIDRHFEPPKRRKTA